MTESGLGQQILDDMCRQNSGEPLIQSLEFVAELFVIEAEQVQNRGVEVTDVQWIADDVVGKVVGFSINGARLGAASGHPHAETARVVIAAVIRF